MFQTSLQEVRSDEVCLKPDQELIPVVHFNRVCIVCVCVCVLCVYVCTYMFVKLYIMP